MDSAQDPESLEGGWGWGKGGGCPISLFCCRLGGEGLVWSSGLLLATPRWDHIYSFKLTLPGGSGL